MGKRQLKILQVIRELSMGCHLFAVMTSRCHLYEDVNVDFNGESEEKAQKPGYKTHCYIWRKERYA
jgi:hypothetical protein